MKLLKKIFPLKEYDIKSFCFPLLILVYVLGFVGVYLIYVLDIFEKQAIKQNLYSKQILAFGIGIVLILFISLVDYHIIAKLSPLIYLFGIGLLLICAFVDTPPIYGWKHYTAKRWIKIGGDPSLGINNPGFEFQPSEIVKIALVITLAWFLFKVHKHIKKLWVLAVAAVITAIPIGMIFTQPDLSTSVLLFVVFAIMVLISGVAYKYIVTALVIFVPTVIFLFWYIQQDFQVLFTEFQQNRVLTMLHPEDYPELAYQQQNAANAIKQGGLTGKVMEGVETSLASRSVPVRESDFIFTSVAEEFGFIGALLVIIGYALMILFIIRIARKAKDYLGRMIAVGFASMLLFQIFINIGVVTSILPNTGIALPFMSSGLSSLLVNLVMIGILLNISLQPRGKAKVREESELGYIDIK
ncbi:MAG: FtsW/RodA/SpoVE family cell cycle protein [Lachnospiraceae bacterium]|nr:FtsW/RodA/SpoVE family cell cycle protein [Lachnospiraceae bacterium]